MKQERLAYVVRVRQSAEFFTITEFQDVLLK